MLYRPLFWTAYRFEDSLIQNSIFNRILDPQTNQQWSDQIKHENHWPDDFLLREVLKTNGLRSTMHFSAIVGSIVDANLLCNTVR